MIDFSEGWDLYHRLVEDGHININTESLNGRDMELLIYDFAQKYYDWKPAEPLSPARPIKEYEQELRLQTANSRLNHIYDIAINWDGERTLRRVGQLVDEIIACTIPPCRSDYEVLEEIKLTKRFKNIPDFLNFHIKERMLPFTWNFEEQDIHAVMDWCDEYGYTYVLYSPNSTSEGKLIGFPITIIKKDGEANGTI